MKKMILKTMMFVFVSVIAFSSCSKNTATPSGDDNNNINSTTVTGNFVITKLTDSNPSEDKTSNFSGYVFTFSENGDIVAVKDGVSTQGSYTQKPSHEGEAAKLVISFDDNTFDDISKSWQIDLMNDSAIHLSDDDNAAEVLEFSAE